MSILPEIAELLDSYLYPVAFGLGGASAIGGFLRLRRSFNIWRHKRALARNPEMSLEEEREHLWRIDETKHPPVISVERLGEFAFQFAPLAIGIAAFWALLDLGYQPEGHDVVMISFFAFMGAVGIVSLWKKLNDPQDDALPSDGGVRFVEAPPDEIHGTLAVGAILLIFALFWWLAP